MTILRDGRDQALECETCSNVTDSYDRDDFDEMVAKAKADGWLIKLEGRDWTHVCPNCKSGDRLAAARAKFR